MYRVLIADDEPLAVEYIKKLVEKRCPGFETAGTAGNAYEALAFLEKERVDVVISDIRMPKMDGISLVTHLRETYPGLYTVIVSGYQEFEYAKGAILAGVENYLLKPVDPAEMGELFEKLRIKLNRDYYGRRNHFLHDLGKGAEVPDEKEIRRLFPAEAYCGAIIRKNGLISRFDAHARREIFSAETENMIIYGRDDQEMLYLWPGELVQPDFVRLMETEFAKQKEGNAFLTMVVKREAFDASEIPSVVRSLYQALDNAIVIGKEQTLYLGEKGKTNVLGERSAEQFQKLLFLIGKRKAGVVPEELSILFKLWEEELPPQLLVESKLRYLFYEMKAAGLLNDWDEYLLDDAFAGARSFSELSDTLGELFSPGGSWEEESGGEYREALFREVIFYLSRHLKDKLTVQTVCQQIGISVATLHRLFRIYASTSFNSYLMNLRIDAAKRMMEEHTGSFVRDVAEEAGFRDQFYFSRVFRSAVGVSPSEYLENCQREAGDE